MLIGPEYAGLGDAASKFSAEIEARKIVPKAGSAKERRNVQLSFIDRIVSQEDRERRPLAGRKIFVSGGTSGSGLFTAQMIDALGGELILGASSVGSENIVPALVTLGRRDVPVLAANLGDMDQVNSTLDILSRSGITDFVHSAAGGMGGFLRRIPLQIEVASRYQGEERDRRLAPVHEIIQAGVEESMPGSLDVNFNGPKALFEGVLEMLPEGGMGIDYNSIWGARPDGMVVPNFYHVIEGPKFKLHSWIREVAPSYAEKKKYLAVIPGHLIVDTGVGGNLGVFFKLLSPEERVQAEEGFILKQDMAKATRMVLESDPTKWGSYPEELYVFGPGGQIAHELPKDSSIYKVKIPL